MRLDHAIAATLLGRCCWMLTFVTLHVCVAEFGTGAMLSVVASLTPYSDFNQSPRNMYQCQMAKQTMGTPMQALCHRPDNKIYRLQTPQRPVTQTGRFVWGIACAHVIDVL